MCVSSTSNPAARSSSSSAATGQRCAVTTAWSNGSGAGTVEGRTAQQRSFLADALGVVGLGPGRDDHLVKRVIGLPGDHVRCCNALGQMEVNGVPLTEPYIRVPAGRPASGEPFDVTVPAGELWVMGDNRYESADSRAHQGLPSKGFVPEREVVGRAVVVSWPLQRWSWVDDHHDVFAGTERGGRDDEDRRHAP